MSLPQASTQKETYFVIKKKCFKTLKDMIIGIVGT